MRNNYEDQLQIMVVNYCEMKRHGLEKIFHVPNGGKRNVFEAKKFKRMGVKSGVPDLVLPVAKNGYHGLYLELKCARNDPAGASRGTLTSNQQKIIKELKKDGYCVKVGFGFEHSIGFLNDYMAGKIEKI